MIQWERFDHVSMGGLANGAFYLVYMPGRLASTKCESDFAVGRYHYDQYGYGGDNPDHGFDVEAGGFTVTHYAELPRAPQ